MASSLDQDNRPLRIELLGPPAATWAGAALAIPRRQARALLFRLAAQAAPVPREQLCFLFWPDEPDASARRSLAHLLTHLRRALPAPELLVASSDQAGLDSASVWVDMLTCERLIATADPRARAAALQQAANLARGPFLAGFSLPDRPEFEEWAAGERQIWERRALETLAALTEHYTALGDYSAAIGAAQRYLAIDELAEEIHRRLIQLHALSGDRGASLRQFERCSEALERELGISPLPETRAAYEAALAGELRIENEKLRINPGITVEPQFSILNSQFSIPVPAGPLIGRERELDAICTLLRRADVRLLTLSGPGGAGKTRLGIAAAAALAAERADGAAFVALAALREPALLAGAIGQALGLRESAGQPLAELLKAALRERQMLLLLDNFEQVVAAAPLLAELLAAAPGLQLLVTSRALLRISSEHVFAVPPLALPPVTNDPSTALRAGERPFSCAQGRRTTDQLSNLLISQPSNLQTADLAQYGAIALFLARVRASSPSFQLTDANAPEVAAICARLDGLPLAIELAAARMKLLSPRMMLARLDRRLALLTDGPRDLPERQQTLRAAIDWSYSLLDVGEQLLLGRLAVFEGGWTLDAAEVVGLAAGELSINVLDGLHALLDKHLVQHQPATDGEPRFALLETIREYALERLTERGEAPATQLAYALYFLDLAERAEPELRGPEQVAWLDRLDDEQANLRAALAWCLRDRGQGTGYRGQASLPSLQPPASSLQEIGLRLAGALAVFWKGRSHLSEGRALLGRAIEIAARILAVGTATGTTHGSAGVLAMRAKALAGAGVLAVFQGDSEAATDQLGESIAIWRAQDDRRWLASTLGYLSMALAFRGEWAQAQAAMEESEQLARANGDAPALALALYGQARTLIERGDDALARAHLEESLAVARAAGDVGTIALIGTDLGQLVLRQGDYATAQAYCEEGLAIARAVRDRGYTAQALNNLGELARCQGDYVQAERCYRESLELFRSQGASVDTPRLIHNLGYVELHRGELARARALFAESLSAFRANRSRRGVAECLAGLAAVALASGHGPRAARLWGAAEALRQAAGVAQWAADQAEHERRMPLLRGALGADALAAAWAAGRALTPEQAIGEALQL
jgi:predicted ATPase/DNA-binding SARP family transcriptional activator